MDDAVRVTTVPSVEEAEVLCGLLRSAGIECGYRPTDEEDSAFEGFSSEGHQEILVHQSELEDAKALLADPQR
jgi:hypothetical protein